MHTLLTQDKDCNDLVLYVVSRFLSMELMMIVIIMIILSSPSKTNDVSFYQILAKIASITHLKAVECAIYDVIARKFCYNLKFLANLIFLF